MLLWETCCCSACLIASDEFTRSNNSDINVGAPFVYNIVSGSFAISSNRLVTTSADAKILFPVMGPEPTGARTIRFTVNGTDGSVARIFVGNHYVDIKIGTNSYYAVCESGGTILATRHVTLAAATTHTITVSYGAMLSSVSLPDNWIGYGVAVVAVGAASIPVICSGTDFGIGTGSSADLAFDSLGIYQNYLLGNNNTLPCFAIAGQVCGPSRTTLTSGSLNPVEWSYTGSWSHLSSTSIRCTSSGRADYIGRFGRATRFRIGFGFQSLAAEAGSGDYRIAWLDSDTGVKIERLADSGGSIRNFEYTPIIGGASGTPFTRSVNQPSADVSAAISLDAFDGGIIATPQVGAAVILSQNCGAYELPELFTPGITDSISGGGNRDYNVLSAGNLSIIEDAGPFANCQPFVGATSGKCTASSPQFDVTFGSIGGTCGDGSSAAANINGVAFRHDFDSEPAPDPIAVAIEVCGVKSFVMVSLKWFNSFGSCILRVRIQVNNAWAVLEKDYGLTPPSCSSVNDTLTLIDHFNDGSIDFSAVTCLVDAV